MSFFLSSIKSFAASVTAEPPKPEVKKPVGGGAGGGGTRQPSPSTKPSPQPTTKATTQPTTKATTQPTAQATPKPQPSPQPSSTTASNNVSTQPTTKPSTTQASATPKKMGVPDTEQDFNQWLDGMRMVSQLPGGMPPEFRRKLWLALSDRYLQNKNIEWIKEQEKCFAATWGADDQEIGIQIVKDLHRTGSSLCTGPSGNLNQAKLKKILLGYARWNPEVGYCQGFNMLGALILQVMDKNEADALKVMIYLIEGVLPSGYFHGSLGGLQADMAVFRELLTTKLPKLAKHLQKLQGPQGENTLEPPLTNVFTMNWFLTLFCNCLPINCVLRVWDLILLEGSDVLLRCALAIWGLVEDKVLEVKSPDDFYCKMGEWSTQLLNGTLVDSNGLAKLIVDLGPIKDLDEMRERHRQNIAALQTKKGTKVFYSDDDLESEEESRLAVAAAWGGLKGQGRRASQPNVRPNGADSKGALDINILKKQYNKLRERQKQAHVILSAAVTRQPPAAGGQPVKIDSLLAGQPALVSNKGPRAGPPPGAIPPARAQSKPIKIVGNQKSMNWKEIKQEDNLARSQDTDSSTSTSLCDEPGMSASSLEGSPLQRDIIVPPTESRVVDLDKQIANMTEDFEEVKEKKMLELERTLSSEKTPSGGNENGKDGDRLSDTKDNNFELTQYEVEQVVDPNKKSAVADPNVLIDLELVEGRYSPLEEFSPIYDSSRFISISPISSFKTPSPILDYSSFLKTLNNKSSNNKENMAANSAKTKSYANDSNVVAKSNTNSSAEAVDNTNDGGVSSTNNSDSYVVTEEGVTNELFERINSADPRLKSPNTVLDLPVSSTTHDAPIIPACADIAAIPADRSPLINKTSFDLDLVSTAAATTTKVTSSASVATTSIPPTSVTSSPVGTTQTVVKTSTSTPTTPSRSSALTNGSHVVYSVSTKVSSTVAESRSTPTPPPLEDSVDRLQSKRGSDASIMQMIEENTKMLAKINNSKKEAEVSRSPSTDHVVSKEQSLKDHTVKDQPSQAPSVKDQPKLAKHVQFVEDEKFNRKYPAEERYASDEPDKNETTQKVVKVSEPEDTKKVDPNDRDNYFTNIMDEIENERESRGLKQAVTEFEEKVSTEKIISKEFQELESIYKRQDSEGKIEQPSKSPIKSPSKGIIKHGFTDDVLKELTTKIEDRKAKVDEDETLSVKHKVVQPVKRSPEEPSRHISSYERSRHISPPSYERDRQRSPQRVNIEFSLKEMYDMRSFDEITREIRKELEVIRTEIQTTRRTNDTDIILEAKSDLVEEKRSGLSHKRSAERRHTTHVNIEHLKTDTLRTLLKETQALLAERESSPEEELDVTGISTSTDDKSPPRSKSSDSLDQTSKLILDPIPSSAPPSKPKVISDIGVDEVPRRLSVVLDKPVQILSPIQEKSPSPSNGSNKEVSPTKSKSPSPMVKTPIGPPDESAEKRMELQKSREKLENLIAQKEAKGEDYSTELKVETVQQLSPRAELTAILTTPPLIKDSDLDYLNDIKSPASDHTELKLFSTYERIKVPSLKEQNSTNINEKITSISKTINTINEMCRGETKYEGTYKTLERMCGKKNVKSMREEMDHKNADKLLDNILSHRSNPLVTVDYVDDNRNSSNYRSRISTREISPRRRKDEEREEYESRMTRYSPVRDYSFTKYDSENFNKLDRYMYKKEYGSTSAITTTGKYDYEPSYRRVSPIKSDKSKVYLDGLEIRHTSVTSTFYDRYLCHKREQSRLDKSPSSPMITRAYLESLRPTPSIRAVKSAENSPSRFTFESSTPVSPSRDLTPTSKYDYRYDYTKSCENISSTKYSSSARTSHDNYSSLSPVKGNSRQGSYDNITQRLQDT